MQYEQLNEVTTKSIKFDNDLLDKIATMAKENERDFSQQVRYMIRKYLQIVEK